MKVKRFGIMIAVLFIAMSTMAAASAGPPPIPSDYSGYVTVNGEPAPDGALVFAKMGDYVSGSVAVANGGLYRLLSVAPPDSDYIGGTIEFYVDPDAGGPMPAVMADETDTFELGTSHDPFNLTLTITDVTPPVIVNVSPTGVSTSGATITWITDEPATSQVEYGETTSYSSLSALDPTLETSHSVALTGLEEGTTYHFRVISADEAENTARSADETFKTGTSSPPPPPYYPPLPTNVPPVAEAGPDRTVYAGVTIHLSASGSQDSDGTIEAYHWFFGDGGYEAGVKVMHVYEEAGAYTAALAVTDNNGATDTDNCTVTVLSMPAEPEAEVYETIPADEEGYVVDAWFWADTTVTVSTTDPVTVTIIKYESNPHPEDPMPETGVPKYVDIFVSDPDAVDWPIYVEMTYTDGEIEGLEEGSLGMYYWREGGWHRCSDTGVDAERNVVWAYMTEEEASGSPILIGGVELPPPPRPAEFEFYNFTVEPAEVETGERVNVSLLVTNVGEEAGNCTVALDVEDGLITSERTVTLGGGEAEALVFEVYPEIEGIYDVSVGGFNGSFEVRAPYVPAEFKVSGLAISPWEVSVGEELTATVTVANVGEVEGTHTVTLEVDGEVSDTADVTLGGGASTAVAFAISRGDPGTYDVEVGGLAGVFRVLRPADFEYSDLSVLPAEVEEGGEVTISVDVCNVGEEEGSHRLELRLDGSEVEVETVTLAGGETAKVSFVVAEGVGTHTVDVEGLAGSFTVTEPAGQQPLEAFPPEYLVAMGAVAIIAIALIARKYMG